MLMKCGARSRHFCATGNFFSTYCLFLYFALWTVTTESPLESSESSSLEVGTTFGYPQISR